MKKVLFVILIVILAFNYYDVPTMKLMPDALSRKYNFNISVPEAKSYDKDVFMTLKIPKISLNLNIYPIDSKYNSVDYNVELLRGSSTYNNLFFIAGHSGNCSVCYFNDLSLLQVGDCIEISIYQKTLYYYVEDIYYVDKIGSIDVIDGDNMLYLITCSVTDSHKQLVVRAKFNL